MTRIYFHTICRFGYCNELCFKGCNFARSVYMQLRWLTPIAWALLKLEAHGLSESTTLCLINLVFMYYLLAHMAYEIWNRILSKKEQNYPLYSVQNLPNREIKGFSTLLVFSFLPHFPIPDSQASCKSEIVQVQVLVGKIAILFLVWKKQIKVIFSFLKS